MRKLDGYALRDACRLSKKAFYLQTYDIKVSVKICRYLIRMKPPAKMERKTVRLTVAGDGKIIYRPGG